MMSHFKILFNDKDALIINSEERTYKVLPLVKARNLNLTCKKESVGDLSLRVEMLIGFGYRRED